MPQTSAPQFSSHLLQNALGQIAKDYSTPACTTYCNSVIPSAVPKDFPGSGWTSNVASFSPVVKAIRTSNTAKVSQHPTAFAAASPAIHFSDTRNASEEIFLGVPSSTMNSRVTLAKTSTVSVVASKSPKFASSPSSIGTLSGSARIPIHATYLKSVTAAATSSSARRLASATALRDAQLLCTSSNVTHPS